MRSELLVGLVLAAMVATLPPKIAWAEEPAPAEGLRDVTITATTSEKSGVGGETILLDEATPEQLRAVVVRLLEELNGLRAERNLLRRENARLVQAEKDRLAGASAPTGASTEAPPEGPVSTPEKPPPAAPTPPKPGAGKTYFVPDLDPAWWTDLDVFARDLERRISLAKGDPDQAVPAWLARVGGLAGTEVEWKVWAKDFSIRSILPEECLRRAKELANPLPIPIHYSLDAKAESAYNSALQAAWTAASKVHGARWVQARVGPCAVTMILPVDALLKNGAKPGGGFNIVGRIVAVRGHQAGLEMFVDGPVEASPSEKPVAN
jgi:hypothetical protein